MSAIDKIVDHYDAQGLKKTYVPEWDLEIFSTPLVVKEQRSLLRTAKDDDLKFLVRALIMKAMDKDGNKLFTIDDEPKLMGKCDSKVLARVVGEMSASKTVEELEGN